MVRPRPASPTSSSFMYLQAGQGRGARKGEGGQVERRRFRGMEARARLAGVGPGLGFHLLASKLTRRNTPPHSRVILPYLCVQ